MKPPSVYLLNTLLRKQGIQRDALRLATACSRHPLPHSIRALSDTLDELQVPNLVCKLEFEQLAEIDGAYIVAAGKTEYPFYLVEKGTGLAGSSVCGPVQVGGLRSRKSGFAALGTARCSWRKRRCVERDTLVRLLVQTAAGLPRPDCSLLVCRTVRSAAWSRLVVETAWVGGFALSGQDAWMCRFAAGDCQIVIQSASCTVLCRLGKHADCNAVFQSAGAKLSVGFHSANCRWPILPHRSSGDSSLQRILRPSSGGLMYWPFPLLSIRWAGKSVIDDGVRCVWQSMRYCWLISVWSCFRTRQSRGTGSLD